MSYTVFARKYRPQTFDDVVGQEHITRTLKNAIEQRRLAHAYIFVGPRGTGKTSTARIFAKSLNCQKYDGPTTQPCGECIACKEIAGGNSLDVLEFDAASNTQVDKVRELIIDNVKYAPATGRFKVYIVDEVHMLSTSSFNALLKTLEEPPGHVKFVFATTDVQKVPTTILSRCQRFDLKRIPTPLIAAHLLHIARQEALDLSPAAAETIAHGAEGGMRDAESMLDQLVAFCGQKIEEADVLMIFGLTAHETVAALAGQIIAGETPGALAALQQESEAGRDLSRLMSDLILHFRNLLVAQADPGSLSGEETEQAVAEFVEQAGRVPREKMLELIEQFAGAEARMRWAPNKKMHFEIALIRAIETLRQATLGEVIETLGALRDGKPLPERPAPAPRPGPSRPEPKAPPARAAKAPPSACEAIPAPPATDMIVQETPKPAPIPEPSPAPATVVVMDAEETSPFSQDADDETPAAPSPLHERWVELVEEVIRRRPAASIWIEQACLLAAGNGLALIGFPSEHGIAQSLSDQKPNRALLEEVLATFAGEALRVKTELREGLVPPVRPKRAPEPPADPVAEFRNDPLIQRALEIFRAQIQTA